MTTQRPFDPNTDVVAIRDFLARMVGAHGQARFLHIGDWLWYLHQREERLQLAAEHVRVWSNPSEKIVGFAWFSPPDSVQMQVDPDASPTGQIEEEMVAWARSRQQVLSGDPPGALLADAFERDERKIAILTQLGFRDTGEDRYNLFRQPIGDADYRPTIAIGAEVRAVRTPFDLEDRVAIHRDVWHPSKVNAASYQSVRSSPGFIPDLDLIATAPDGTIAAYATVWYDPVNRIGEFEPVGARSAYRRQGYALAVMREGLRRLQAIGAVEAIVYSFATNDASNGLYTRSGFRIDGQDHTFRRADDTSSSDVG